MPSKPVLTNDKFFNIRHFILQSPLFAAIKFAMVEADPQFVLRCGQCNKPFDKGGLYLHQI